MHETIVDEASSQEDTTPVLADTTPVLADTTPVLADTLNLLSPRIFTISSEHDSLDSRLHILDRSSTVTHLPTSFNKITSELVNSPRQKELCFRRERLQKIINALRELEYRGVLLVIIEALHANIKSECYMQQLNDEQRTQEFARSYIVNCREYIQQHFANDTNISVITRIIQQLPEEELVKLAHKLHYLLKTSEQSIDTGRIFESDDPVFLDIKDWYNDYVIKDFNKEM